MGLRAQWRALPSEHRRWIVVNALGATALINFVVNALVAWFNARDVDDVPLWGSPVGDPNAITDAVGTTFLLPLITVLITTTVIWREIRLGTLPALAPSVVVHPWLTSVPRRRLRRAIGFGVLCTAAVAPFWILALVAADFGDLSVSEFVLYKGIAGVALGAIVTPLIAICAMTGPVPERTLKPS